MTEYHNVTNVPIAGSARFQQDTAMAISRLKSALGPTGGPVFRTLGLTGLTASRLVSTDTDKTLASVANLASWIAGTTNRVTVTNDGDGTITLSGPQDIHTSASPTFAGLTVVNSVNEFSIDGTMAGNSDSALPTEKAVVTYVTAAVGAENLWDRTDTVLSPHTAGDSISLGAGSITMTGSLGATGARVTKGWFTDLECTNAMIGGLIPLSASSGVLIKNFSGNIIASFGLGGTDSKNVALLGNLVVTGTSTNAGIISSGIFDLDTTNSVAGGATASYTGISQITNALTGTLRGVYSVVTNGEFASSGTIRAFEGKVRAATSGLVGGNVGTLEGMSLTADAKNKTVTLLRGAEIIMDGQSGAAVTTAVGLRLANNFQTNIATTSYGLQIYRDSFDYTADIQLSSGGKIGGSSGNLVITNSGKVGIGTTTPNVTLEVGNYGTPEVIGTTPTIVMTLAGNVAGTTGMLFKNKSTSANADTRLSILDDAGEGNIGFCVPSTTMTSLLFGIQGKDGVFIWGDAVSNDAYARHLVIGTWRHKDVIFGTSNTERMRILARTGEVGIGKTPTVGVRLDVSGSGAFGTTLNVGGFGTPLSGLGTPTVKIAANINGTGSVQMYNASTGTSADFRFIVSNDAKNQYIAFVTPSDANSSTLFGVTRGTGNFVFNNTLAGGTNRSLVVGTVPATSLILGTKNLERLQISSTGVFTLTPDANTDLTVNFTGTTNSGLLYWMEDEDYFKFSDDILMNSTEKIHFLDTAIGIYSQADTFLDIFADGGLRIGDSSAGAPTNYTVFEADGTLKFNGTATVFNDANVAVVQLTLPVASQPDEVNFLDELGADTGITTWGFAVNELVNGSIEIPHDYKEGTDLTFHVHWQGITSPGGGTDNVKWELVYTVAHGNDTLNAVTTITVETAITTQYGWYRTDFAAITGTNLDIGDQFLFRLKRVAASADEYAGDALVATIGFHYECDTVGSRTITTK